MFWDWKESNPSIGSPAIALWFALMDTANKAGWPKEIYITRSTLQSKTDLGKDAIYSARKKLKEKGRIDYQERKGNQSTAYRIIPFVSDKPTQTPPQQVQAPPFVSDKPTQTPMQQAQAPPFVSDKPTQTPTQQVQAPPFVSDKPTQTPTQQVQAPPFVSDKPTQTPTQQAQAPPFVADKPTQTPPQQAQASPFVADKPTQTPPQQVQASSFVSDKPTQTQTQPPSLVSVIVSDKPTQSPTQTSGIPYYLNNKTRLDNIISVSQSDIDYTSGEKDGLTEILENVFGGNDIPLSWQTTIQEILRAMYYAPGIMVSGKRIDQMDVREQLQKLDGETVKWAIEKMSDSGEVIKNPSAYLTACLYNAPVDYDAAISIRHEKDFGKGPWTQRR